MLRAVIICTPIAEQSQLNALRPSLPLIPFCNIHLVLASSRLAGLQLLQVPPANLHVSAVVIHALGEACCRTRAVVAPFVLLLRLGADLLLWLLGRGGGTAAEEATDGVADRRAYCYTAVEVSIVSLRCPQYTAYYSTS